VPLAADEGMEEIKSILAAFFCTNIYLLYITKMNKFVLLCVLALFATCTVGQFSWSNCGNSGDVYQVSDVVIFPYPPQKGQLIISVLGVSSGNVTGGSIRITASYWIFTVLNQTSSLCTQVACPVHAGSSPVVITSSIPSSAASGTYDVNAKATDQNGNRLICVDFSSDG